MKPSCCDMEKVFHHNGTGSIVYRIILWGEKQKVLQRDCIPAIHTLYDLVALNVSLPL